MKSVKITAAAHKGLQLLAAVEDIKQSEFASMAIMETIEKEYPDVYQQLRKWMISNDHEGEGGGKQP